MRRVALGIALAGAAFAFVPLLKLTALDAATPAPSDLARIEQAIQTYEINRQAAEETARDRLIAGKTSDLLNDPLTPVIGDAGADVAIVEFFDYTCPYCKVLEPRLEKLLNDDKRVKLVVKEYPILSPEALVATKAALASVKQGKYAQYHQAMMMFRGQLQTETIFDIAKDAGLNVERLRKDMQAPEITDEIIANFNLARGLRISQTPAFIVAGHMLTGPSAEIDFPKVVAAARAK